MVVGFCAAAKNIRFSHNLKYCCVFLYLTKRFACFSDDVTYMFCVHDKSSSIKCYLKYLQCYI